MRPCSSRRLTWHAMLSRWQPSARKQTPCRPKSKPWKTRYCIRGTLKGPALLCPVLPWPMLSSLTSSSYGHASSRDSCHSTSKPVLMLAVTGMCDACVGQLLINDQTLLKWMNVLLTAAIQEQCDQTCNISR